MVAVALPRIDLPATCHQRWVVYSAGYANQYGHPHKRTVARYQLEGAVQVGTAEQGALRWCSSRSQENFESASWCSALGKVLWARSASADQMIERLNKLFLFLLG